MRIGDAVKLRVDQLDENKLFLYTQKTGVPVYTVLPYSRYQGLGRNPAGDRSTFLSATAPASVTAL